jgi:hypothetical protein
MIGQGLEDSSGRAIQLLQQAGLAELGPYLSAYKNWKLRVYRDCWNIVQRHWKNERWIRVTDDMNIAKFFQINKLTLNEWGQPIIVNAVGELDVDIIIDEGPDVVNMQGDAMMVLQSLGPQFLQQFPEIAIELSPLPSSVKKPMLDKIQQQQNKPPPPDPRVMAIQAKAQIDQATAQQDIQRDNMQAQQEAALRQQEADRDAQNQVRQQQLDAQARQAEMAHQAMLDRMEAQNQIMIQRMQASADIVIAHIKAQAEMKIAEDAHERQMAMAEEQAATGIE